MHFGRNTAWRQTSRVRPALIATLIAIPLAAGVGVGVIASNHSGNPTSQLKLSSHNFGIGSRLPLATGSAAGTGVDLGQTPAQAADSMNCTLQVPANPLSARGLASPYVLGDGCEMSNADLQAYVEADIINPRTGRITVYNPLVITEGTTPAAAPVPPRVRRGDVVGIMFGFNGDNLLLTGTGNSLRQGNCVNGLGQSLFTQVAYCNSPAFYRAANRDIARGLLTIPALSTGSDGQACPTVRGYDVVDQDQSDNVVTTYLLTPSGQTAQDSAANAAGLAGATAINNGSDNALVNKFMDPALGCTPYEFHDKTAAARRVRLADHRRADGGGRPARAGRAGAAERPDDPGQWRVEHDEDQHVPDRRGSAAGEPGPDGGYPGQLLQEHDPGRRGAHLGGREAVQRVRHPGGRHRQQPVHVPGRAAFRLVGEPGLQRPAQRA